MDSLPKPYFQLGGATLFHGDCRDVISQIPSESINLIITDPPYGGILREQWDRSDDTFGADVIRELHRVLKPSGSIYVWCGIGEKSRSLPVFMLRLDPVFHFKDLITWKKRRGIGMRKGWLYTREEILWYVKDNACFFWNKERQYSDEPNQFTSGMDGHPVQPFKRITNVWTDIPEPLVRKESDHPASKPVEAMRRIVLAHTLPGEIVLDPFCGGGSTLIAAISEGRRAIGIEAVERYCTTAAQWLEESVSEAILKRLEMCE